MSDKYKEYINLIKDCITKFTPQSLRYRKPMIEVPNIPETRAVLSLMTDDEFGFLFRQIIPSKIDPRKPLEERFFFKLTHDELDVSRASFFRKMKRYKELGIIEKQKGVNMYMLNPAFANTGFTFKEKYELGFISEREFIAKMRFSNRVKQMSGK